MDNPPCPFCQYPMTAQHYDIDLKEHANPLSFCCEGWGNYPGCGHVQKAGVATPFMYPEGAPVFVVMPNEKKRPGRVVGHNLHPKLGWLNLVLQGDGSIGRFKNSELRTRMAIV